MGRLARILAAGLTVLALASPAASAKAEGALRLQSVEPGEGSEITLGLVLPVDLFDPEGPLPEFTVEENGRKVRIQQARALTRPAERDPIDVVLLVDTSGSMKGKPLEDAKTAARAFVGSLAPGDSVAVMGFSSSPALAMGFSDDLGSVAAAIDSLEARGETAVFDALYSAAQMISARGTRNRTIVLLSDGADTVSARTSSDALDAVRDAEVPVYAVTIESPEFDTRALVTVADASGGRAFVVEQSAELEARFASIAVELQNLYEVTFVSEEPNTVDLEIDVTAEVGDNGATLSTAIDNPFIEAGFDRGSPVEDYRVEVRSDPLMLTLVVAVAFAAVALLASGLILLLARGPRTLDQLAFYDQLQSRPEDAEGAPGGADGLRTRVIETIGYVAGRRGITEILRVKLERAGLPLRPLEYIYLHLIGVIAIGFAVRLLTGSMVASILMVLFAVVGPLIALEVVIERRRRTFEEQLPEILSLIAGSIRAGWGLLQSLDLVVQELSEPAAGEFRRVESEARLGLPLDEALSKMAERLDSDDFRWTVIAINIQREVGGNLAEVLDILGQTMRDRAELKRHVRALTAEGRLSAVILYALPFLAMLTLSVTNPEYMADMFSHPVGVGMLLFGVALLAVGGFWLSRAIKVEV